MRIGLYIDTAMEKQPRGVGYHVLNLIQALSHLDQENEYLLYYQSPLLTHVDQFDHLPKQPNFRIRPVRFPTQWKSNHPTVWWKHYLPWIIQHDRVEVFHGPNHFLPIIPTVKSIVTIHDMAFFKMELYSSGWTAALRYWTQSALQQASRVIAISENTRADIEAMGIESKKMRVIYGGGHIMPEAQIQYDRQEELRCMFHLPERYIVFVGTLGLRKNIPFLLRGFAKLKSAWGLPHSLVLVGMKFAGFEEIEESIRDLGLERDVIITGYVDDWQIPLFYKMADLFVLPTLYEGFTLVTLEAMAYGVPIIATATSSIKEGTGDAALLVEVNDVEGLANAMHTVLTSPQLREDMIRLGKAQFPKFTWERCASETLSLYKEVYEEHRR